jgi:hypothetical protein
MSMTEDHLGGDQIEESGETESELRRAEVPVQVKSHRCGCVLDVVIA